MTCDSYYNISPKVTHILHTHAHMLIYNSWTILIYCILTNDDIRLMKTKTELQLVCGVRTREGKFCNHLTHLQFTLLIWHVHMVSFAQWFVLNSFFYLIFSSLHSLAHFYWQRFGRTSVVVFFDRVSCYTPFHSNILL